MSTTSALALELSGIPTTALPSPPPAWIIRILLWLRAGLLTLANAFVPPEVQVFERATGVAYTVALAIFVKSGYADLFNQGPLSADDVANKLGRDRDATFRFLHLLASAGMLQMQRDGRFAHNRVSKTLTTGHPTRAGEFAKYFASGSNVQAWLDLDQTLQTGKNAFERVHGMDVWAWFDKHPDERECFAHAMMGLTLATAPFVAAHYPFHEAKTVCDVGGGRGTLLSEILLRHPHLQGELVDAAGVLESARALLAHRSLEARVTLTPSSFFTSVPSGADVYLLKNILHDWDDARCLQILKNVRTAAKPGQRVVVIESILDRTRPDPLVSPADVQMMVVCCEGRERSLADFHRLLQQAGFDTGRSWSLPTVGIVEGIAR